MEKKSQSNETGIYGAIQQMLVAENFDRLPQADQDAYLPQFVSEVERRIGIAILPKLPPEGADEFAEMTKKKDASPEEWATFWQSKVPDYEEVVRNVLTDFQKELHTLMNQSKNA